MSATTETPVITDYEARVCSSVVKGTGDWRVRCTCIAKAGDDLCAAHRWLADNPPPPPKRKRRRARK